MGGEQCNDFYPLRGYDLTNFVGGPYFHRLYDIINEITFCELLSFQILLILDAYFFVPLPLFLRMVLPETTPR